MAFRSEHQNPLQDLCEISLRIAPTDNEGNSDSAFVTLGIFPAAIPHDDYEMAVAIKRAILTLDINGAEIIPGSKLGMSNIVVVEREVIRETADECQSEVGVAGAGSFSVTISPKEVGANAGAKAEASRKEQNKYANKTTIKSAEKFIRVRAKNRNNWEVREEGDKVLDDHYLNDSEICKISSSPGANRRVISITVYAMQKDISIHTECGRLMRLIKQATDRNLLKILAAKALHRTSSASNFSGIIHLSHSECTDED